MKAATTLLAVAFALAFAGCDAGNDGTGDETVHARTGATAVVIDAGADGTDTGHKG